MSPPRFVPGHAPPARPREDALLFVTRGLDLLVAARDGAVHMRRGAELPALAAEALYLGMLDQVDCYAAPWPRDAPVPPATQLLPARSLHGRVDEALFAVGGRAVAIVEWDVQHRF